RSASFRMCILGEISVEHRFEHGKKYPNHLLRHLHLLFSNHQSDVAQFDRRGELGQIKHRS
ncbi:hypothetical protein PENTCL1PPCAC_4091, partial [Pristionchus entomophagus]